MKVLCVGGAGRICREAIMDLVATTTANEFSKITVADFNEEAGNELVKLLNDPRVDFEKADVNKSDELIELMKQYDLVMDGTAISMNVQVMRCAVKAKVHGMNLNGFGGWELDQEFKNCNKIFIPGIGMTPGTTNLMTMFACNRMDTVDTIRISHGAYRPIAYSAAIAETTETEYRPDYEGRVVFEDGEFKQVPPFGRPRMIDLPEPFGSSYQYIIPHPETITLAKSVKDKGVRLIEVRGTWPPKNMELLKALYDWGFTRNDKVKVKDVHGNLVEVGTMDVIVAHWLSSPEGKQTDLYGYSLHVEVIGTRDKRKVRHILTSSHPSSDGSIPEWAGLRAYVKSVGIPMSIATQLIAAGKSNGVGTVPPELAFDPKEFIAELAKRGILIHERIEEEWTVA
jgi:saccharopine dehydrogenase-like NADP-dependent oxidoreductase